MYVLGNTKKVVGDSKNPQSRKTALEGSAVINKNGWRVWIEHHKTGNRLYENEREKAERIPAPQKGKRHEDGLF